MGGCVMENNDNKNKQEADNIDRKSDLTLVQSASLAEMKLPPSWSVSISEKIQITGLNLCYITIGLIGLVSIVLIIYFYIATRSIELAIGTPTKETIQFYKDARAAITDDIVKISDRFLGSVLRDRCIDNGIIPMLQDIPVA